MLNLPLTPPPATSTNSEVGDLTTPNTKGKVLPPSCKTVWEEDKTRKNTNGGGWECLWCGRSLLTTQRIFLKWQRPSFLASTFPCVYPRYQIIDLQDIKPFWTKIGARTPKKERAQEQVNQDINKLQDTGSKVLSANKYQHYSSSSQSPPPPPCRIHIPHFKLFFWGKSKTVNKALKLMWGLFPLLVAAAHSIGTTRRI